MRKKKCIISDHEINMLFLRVLRFSKDSHFKIQFDLDVEQARETRRPLATLLDVNMKVLIP